MSWMLLKYIKLSGLSFGFIKFNIHIVPCTVYYYQTKNVLGCRTQVFGGKVEKRL